MSNEDGIEAWVKKYHAMGFSPIPLKKKSKAPNGIEKDELKYYFYYRPNEDVINTWLEHNLYENIGLLLGHQHGELIFFDFDDPEAFKFLNFTPEGLIEKGKWVVETPKKKGRYHVAVVNNNGNLDDVTRVPKCGVELRYNKHYVAVYPSIHPNGVQYNLLNTHNPDELIAPVTIDASKMWEQISVKLSELCGVDETLQDRLQKKKEYDNSPECVRNSWELGAIVGQRTHTALGLGSWMSQKSFPETMTKDFILQWFRKKCNIEGRPESDILKAVETGYINYKTGCQYWRTNTQHCPYSEKKDCPFFMPETKNYKEIVERYNVLNKNEEGKIIGVNTGNLAAAILEEFDLHFITLNEKTAPMWFWNEKCYMPNAELKIGELVNKLLGGRRKKGIREEVVDNIKHNNIQERFNFNQNQELINLQNGVYHLKEKKLYPHDPKYKFTFVLPITYDPDANSEEFEEFLTNITKKDGKNRTEVYETLQEFFGYMLFRGFPFKKYLVMDGDNNNGKTQLMLIITAVLGSDNITNVSLQDLNDKTFTKSKLFGKHGNFADDLPNKTMKYSGVIKEITGSSPIWGDIKNHKEGIQFINFAKPFYACNELPYSYDIGNAFFDRQLQVTLYNKYVKKGNPDIDGITTFERIVDIHKKFTTEEKKSGIFNWMLRGLERLLQNEKFTDETTIEEKRKTWLEKSDPIGYYIETQLEKTYTDWVIISDVLLEDIRQEYKNKNLSELKITKNNLTRKLSNIGVEKKRITINNDRPWCYIGIKHITDNTINNYVGKIEQSKLKENDGGG